MSTTATLTFTVRATGDDLRLCVRLDDTIIYDGYPGADPEQISCEFDDTTETAHSLCFEMRGKKPGHTVVDSNGVIVQDRRVYIEDVAFDDILLGQVFSHLAKYYHNHNDSTDPITDQFFGEMGCNGVVELKFTTPIYLWLLENM